MMKRYLVTFVSGDKEYIDSDGYLDALAQAAALRAKHGPVSTLVEQKKRQ